MSGVNTGDWELFSPHLDALLELTVGEQEAYLRALEESAPEVAAQLRKLVALQRANSADGFLARPVADAVARGGHEGVQCGAYVLDTLIGRGGMGSVWKAHRHDGRYDAVVAVKLLNTALLDRDSELRFKREGQILGRLSHPNIARLLDAGMAADGQPFLVLEYVEGQHIDRYCEQRTLSLADRVRLFVHVLDAVSHAHANLVVHRDLKPSNILVDETGRIKLLDFGIAKLLPDAHGEAAATDLTVDGAQPRTPLYATPEQITGTEATTATDVYALGVVLYELLTGGRPYKLVRDSRGELEEAILSAPPIPPSELVGPSRRREELRGDLDTILLKALRKEPSARYATVAAFEEDLRAWLEGRPVRARPASFSYRASRFVKRNRVLVGAASAVSLAVVGGAVAALWQASEARAAQARAEGITAFVTGIFRDADPYVGEGKTLSATDLLIQADARLGREQEVPAEQRLEIRWLIGSSLASLQAYRSAEPILREVAAESEQRYGLTDERTLRALVGIGGLNRFKGDLPALDSSTSRVLAILRAQPNPDPEVLANVLIDRAHLAIDQGKAADGVAPAREALAIADSRLSKTHSVGVSAAQVLAVVLDQEGRDRLEALEAAKHAVERTRARYGGVLSHPSVVEGQMLLGVALGRVKQRAEAIRVLEEADSGAVVGMGPNSFTRAFIKASLGFQRLEAGADERAVADYRESLRLLAVNGDTASPSVAIARANLGSLLLRLGRPGEALPLLRQAQVSHEKTLGPKHARTLLARTRVQLARSREGEVPAALAELQTMQPAFADSTLRQSEARRTWLMARSEMLRRLQRPAEALPMAMEAVAMTADTLHYAHATVLAELGAAQQAAGRSDEAAETLAKALAQFRRVGSDTTRPEMVVRQTLAQLRKR